MLREIALATVQNYLDNANSISSPRWSTAELYRYLESAQYQVTQEFCTSGSRELMQTQTVLAPQDGYIAVSPNHKIMNVFWDQGNGNVIKVSAGTAGNRGFANSVLNTGSILIEFVPKSSFPSVDGEIIKYAGLIIDNPMVDSYLCILAAREAKVKTGEINPALEAKYQDLRKQLWNTPNSPSVYLRSSGRSAFNHIGNTFWYRSGLDEILIYNT